MKYTGLAFSACVALVFATACGGSNGNGQCRRNANCQAGWVCISGGCRRLCSTQVDCTEPGTFCDASSVCASATPGIGPQLTGVVGNDPADVTRVRNGIIVSGTGLTGAVFELRQGAGAAALTVVSQSDLGAELLLPADIRKGDYTLVATNAAGGAALTVTLLLPDLNGEEIVNRINTQATGTIKAIRLPVGSSAGTVAAGDHNHDGAYVKIPAGPGRTQADAWLSCKAVKDAGVAGGDGVYWLNVDGAATAAPFPAYCDMTTNGGGWTLVMNVEPADGSVVSFTNTVFWNANAEYGQMENGFTHDYKGPAAWRLPANEVMVEVVRPGPQGQVLGWKAWPVLTPPRTFGSFFASAVNTVQTGVALASDVTGVDPYEPIIKNGSLLVSNRSTGLNGDRARLSVDAYAQQGDDNEPGLGTQMNETICGAGVNCYRYWDVELWVNSTANLWCTRSGPGSFKWIGTDGGCGDTCGLGCALLDGRISPYWTYRIYAR